jgi:hypothetical protein
VLFLFQSSASLETEFRIEKVFTHPKPGRARVTPGERFKSLERPPASGGDLDGRPSPAQCHAKSRRARGI